LRFSVGPVGIVGVGVAAMVALRGPVSRDRGVASSQGSFAAVEPSAAVLAAAAGRSVSSSRSQRLSR
jgi:hypothetical protein